MLFLEWTKVFAFEQKNMQRLWLDVFTENNKRTDTLYTKSGFTQEGIKRKTVSVMDMVLILLKSKDLLDG